MTSSDTVTRFLTQEKPLSRRAALRVGGIFAADAVLSAHGLRPAAAQEATPAEAAIDAYPEVVVVGADFRFELPASAPAGLTRLTLQNDGIVDHHAMFMRLNDDAEMADLEAALQSPDLGPILAVSQSLGGPEVGAGLSATVIADLLPGQYQVICVIPEADGTPHYMMGMYAPFEVTEPGASATPPAADATVELVDFAFEMPAMDFPAGAHVWEAPNVGEQVHEMVIFRLAEGVTPDQGVAMLTAPPATPGAMATPAAMAGTPPAVAGAPPFALVGGVAPMSPGFTNWALLDLEPADYIAICFVPDPGTGLPHFALGMVMPFRVE